MEKKRSFTASVHGGHIRSPFFSVYDRIAPYTDTEIYDRNTGPYNTTKYDRIRRNTDRLRAYTDSVIVDLGMWNENTIE